MVMSEQARRNTIENALQQRTSDETLRLNWKGDNETFPVVKVPLDAVVLNPHSHRIKAQILSHPDRDKLERKPFTDKAQAVFAKMLQDTEDYEKLKQNLKEEKQREPGVVTRSGLLVNANRRVTALRELSSFDYVRLALLPQGVSNREIADIESDLQVRKSFQAPYSFTNRLLLVEENLVDHGRSKKEVALRLREATSRKDEHLKEGVEKIEQYQRILALIREARELSEDKNGDPQVDFSFFDGKQQHLEEIDEAYEKEKKRNPQKAQRLKKARLIGLFSDYKYREMRRIDATFLGEFFVDAAEELREDLDVDFVSLLKPEGGDRAEPETDEELDLELLGDDELTGEGEDEDDQPAPDPTQLINLLATTHGHDSVEVPTAKDGETKRISREDLISQVNDVLDHATEEKRVESKQKDRLESPIDRTSEAQSKLRRARKYFLKVKDNDGFDHETMEDKIASAERALDALKQAFGEHSKEKAAQTEA